MIHVCFGLYDKDGRYSKFTGTTIASIFENVTPPRSVTVHLLHDNTLTEDNRDKFSYTAGQYNQLIKFYNVEKICADKIEKIQQMMSAAAMFSRFTIGTVYRILAADLLPNDVNTLVYFDSDIIVNLDIKEFVDFYIENNAEGKPLGAVSDFDCGIKHEAMYWAHNLVTSGMLKYTDYLAAAVLIIDLKYWRENQNLI